MRKGPIAGIVAAAIIIPFAVWTIGPLFSETTVLDEPLPDNVVRTGEQAAAKAGDMADMAMGEAAQEIASGLDTMGQMADTVMQDGVMDADEADMMGQAREELESKIQAIADTESPEVVDALKGMLEEAGSAAMPSMPEMPAMPDMPQGQVAKTYAGTFMGTGDGIHEVEGRAKIVPLRDGGSILRLENFESKNGPDLYVYLATDKRATEFVSLGKLKALSGNQNYEIPEGTDLDKYDEALIWCQPFHMLFGNAKLSPQ